MEKTTKGTAIIKIIALVLITLIIGGCSDSNEPCYMNSFCDGSPTKKYTTANGTERYYCKKHREECAFCSGKATKNYTNLFDFHIFVCDNHYPK